MVEWIILVNDFFKSYFVLQIATTINMRQGCYPIDGCIKEDSSMEKLQPQMYVLYALILVLKFNVFLKE